MGDRSSISFKNGDRESVALFHHWGGKGLAKEARAFVKKFRAQYPEQQNYSDPFTRLEPAEIMVQFIRSMESAGDSVYLGKDKNDGDNSDRGHTVINLSNL